MIINKALELEKKYMQYAILDDDGDIIGFKPNAPLDALAAAKEHIEMSKHFDDMSNYEYWNEKMKDLGLSDINISNMRNTDAISLDDLLSGKIIKCPECGEGYYIPIGHDVKPENAQGFTCNNCGDRINFTPAKIVIE